MKTTARHTYRHPWKSFVLAIGVGLNLFIAMLTVFSAYGGTFDPDERVIAAMAAMLLPAFLLAGGVLFALDLFFDRRLVFILLAGWLVSLPSIVVFSPFNLLHKELTPAERDRSFTLLTYNVLHFWDFRGHLPDVDCNATVQYILDTDADIVSLQEYDAMKPDGEWKITRSQLDSLEARYPYRFENLAKGYCVMSKFKFDTVPYDIPEDRSCPFILLRLDVRGCTVHLADVHLKSIGLTPEDKSLYKETLNIPENRKELRRELSGVKSQLLTKLADAFRVRAGQARLIRHIVDSIGGPFIVAGDFNDIPDCYAVRTIRGNDMSDAYADAAFGPTITYHGDRFYFRIDQVLYRGPFRAVDIERGDIGSSDHNPLLTTFLFDKKEDLVDVGKFR